MKRALIMLAALVLIAGCQANRWEDDRLELGMTPGRMVCDGGRLYVADRQRVLVVDEATGRVLRQFDGVERYPVYEESTRRGGLEAGREGEAFDPGLPEPGTLHPCRIGSIAVAGGKLFANEIFAGNLLIWDLARPGAPARLKMPDQGELVAAPGGKEVYYASNGTAFFRIDTRTDRPTRVRYPTGAKGIGAARVGPDGRMLYLALQRGAQAAGATPPLRPDWSNGMGRTGPLLAVYDLVEQRYVGLHGIGDTRFARSDDASIPTSLSFSEDGTTLYITLWQCGVGVHVFDVRDRRLLDPLVLPDTRRNGDTQFPECWDAAQRGDHLYVVQGHDPRLVRVDLRDGSVAPVARSGKTVCRNAETIYVAVSRGIQRIR